jgi:peptidoglycan/xylan/chitin deacetylase (PgdA/CDA1 family)
MFTRIFAFIVRVLIGLLLLLLCQFYPNIHGISAIYAKSSDLSYELYKQLMHGKRIYPINQNPKAYITPKQPTVYLTFDDGPSVETPKVLEILKKAKIKATFFMVGKMAEEHPEWVNQVVKDGHAIGNHSYNHVYKQLYNGNVVEFWRQIQQTEKILYGICGVKPQLVRAPGGSFKHFDAFYYYDMEEAGYTMMDWNMDSSDSSRANVPANEIVTKVKQSVLRHEVILLLHDGTGHSQTVQALPEIIDYFKKLGYVFAPLTINVKPVQAPLASKMSSSSYSYDQFTKQEARVKLVVSEHQRQVMEAKQKAEEARVLALRPHIPLSISYNNEKRTLQAEEYEYKANKLYVPLQELASVIGVNLVWDNLDHLVTAYYGQRKVEYHLAKHTMVVFEPNGKSTIYGMQFFAIRNGKLEVPMRSTVESLGNYIGAVQKLASLSEVTINQGFATQIIMDCSGIFAAPLGETALLQG